MYPDFLKQAQAEGNAPAVRTFELAMKVETIHHGLYSEALKALGAGKDLPARKTFVCSICGNTLYDNAPDVCPICGGKRSFEEVI